MTPLRHWTPTESNLFGLNTGWIALVLVASDWVPWWLSAIGGGYAIFALFCWSRRNPNGIKSCYCRR